MRGSVFFDSGLMAAIEQSKSYEFHKNNLQKIKSSCKSFLVTFT